MSMCYFIHTKKHNILKISKKELPMWHNEISCVLGVLGLRFNPWPSTVSERSRIATAVA